MPLKKTPALIAILIASAQAGATEYRVPTKLEARHAKGENKAVIAILEKIIGPSFIQRKGRGGKSDTSLGMRVFENDRLISERSRVHARYKDGTYIEMGEESSFGAERVRFKPANPLPANKPSDDFDESVFRFFYGVIRITAPDVHQLEHFTVKTANAVLKITGPADFYLIQLVNDRDMTVRVSRGKVELMNVITNEHMQVPEGSGAYLKVSGLVTGAGPFTEEQLAFLKSRTRI